MIENGCCLIHFGVLKETRTFGGDLGGGGGGGGGGWGGRGVGRCATTARWSFTQQVNLSADNCHWNFGPEIFGPGRKFSLKILVRPDR